MRRHIFITLPALALCLFHLSSIATARAVNSATSTPSATFSDRTQALGLNQPTRVFEADVAWVDYDQDGNVDLLVGDRLYRNLGPTQGYRFEDVSDAVGLGALRDFGAFGDINGDGLVDLVCRNGQLFIQGPSGHFEDHFADSGLQGKWHPFTITVQLVDFDGDGLVDILTGMVEKPEADGNSTLFPPQAFKNIGNGHFVDVSEQLGLSNLPQYTRSIAVSDYNHDGVLDYYYSNYRLMPNQLFSLENGQFVDRAKEKGVQKEFQTHTYNFPVLENGSVTNKEFKGPWYGHSIGSTWADFDNDGNLDLWVSNLAHKGVTQTDQRGVWCDDSKFYRNTGAPDYHFVDMRSNSGIPILPVGPRGEELWSHITAADFNGDGFIDAFVPQIYNLAISKAHLFENHGGWKFTETTEQSGITIFGTYAGAWADYDNDGYADLITVGKAFAGATSDTVHLYHNDLSNKAPANYVRLDLKSRHPLEGTLVRLKLTDGQTLTRQVEGTTGAYNQQNDPRILINVPLGKTVKSMLIDWSWGFSQEFAAKEIRMNQAWKIQKD